MLELSLAMSTLDVGEEGRAPSRILREVSGREAAIEAALLLRRRRYAGVPNLTRTGTGGIGAKRRTTTTRILEAAEESLKQ
jgi:hypothetical protein